MVKLELVPTTPDAARESLEFDRDAIEGVIAEACAWMAERQADDGHWAFELEADATIPAEYIMLNHYLDEVDDETESKLVNYLKETQGKHGAALP